MALHFLENEKRKKGENQIIHTHAYKYTHEKNNKGNSNCQQNSLPEMFPLSVLKAVNPSP